MSDYMHLQGDEQIKVAGYIAMPMLIRILLMVHHLVTDPRSAIVKNSGAITAAFYRNYTSS